MNQPTMQEVQALQGTRLQEKAPWETYGSELDQRLDPRLAEAVAAYSEKRYEESNSSQTKEELHRQKEMNNDLAKQYQWLSPDEYADTDARIGRVMTHATFITELRRLRLPCWYTQHPHPDKVSLLYLPDPFAPPELLCWVQYGYMPELSIMNFDDHGVPTNERRRGWRTCLLQVILKGALDERKAHKSFGQPRMDTAFQRYNVTLQSARNAGGRLV